MSIFTKSSTGLLFKRSMQAPFYLEEVTSNIIHVDKDTHVHVAFEDKRSRFMLSEHYRAHTPPKGRAGNLRRWHQPSDP